MLLTVIIPVYNAGQFLPRCLDSVIRQQDTNLLEVIAVNDGSTDDSLAILQRYAEQYPFIHVLTQPNKGQAAARNEALHHATGDRVLFLDADDYWSDHYLVEILPGLTDDIDVLQTGYTWLPVDGEPIVVFCRRPYRFLSAWSKVIRREFLITNRILFPEGLYYDDPIWAARLWQAKPRIALSASTGYHYCQNSNSVTANRQSTAEVRRLLREAGLHIYDYGWLRLRLTAHFIKERL